MLQRTKRTTVLRRIAACTFAPLLLLVGSLPSFSQSSFSRKPIYVGGGIQGGFNMHDLALPVYRGSTYCGTFDGANSILPNGFLTYERPLGETFSSLWIAPRIHLNGLGALITTAATDNERGRSPIDSSLVPISRVHRLDASLLALGADLLVKYPVTNSLFIFGGPSVSYLLRRDMNQTEAITEPADAVFTDGSGQTRTLYNGEIPNSTSLLAALSLGASVDIPVSQMVALAPEISLRLALNPIRSDYRWHVSTLAIGAALKFNVAPEANLELVHRESEEKKTLEPPKSEIRANIKLYGVGVDSTGREWEQHTPTLRIEESLRREAYPLLSYIFFAAENANIPSRYHMLSTDRARQQFAEQTFLGKDELSVEHDVLNIIGSRMAQRPASTITLTGTVSGTDDGTTELARQRATAVKQYLVSTWKIPPNRIAVEATGTPKNASNSTTPEGLEENRRVEIVPSDPALLDPPIVEQIDRTMTPPKLRLRTSVFSALPLKQNSLTLMQGSRTLLRYNSNEPVVDWTPSSNELPTNDTSIVATFLLRDEHGTSVELHDSAHVQLLTLKQKREARIPDRIVEHYNLVTFDFDKSDIDKRSERTIREIAQNVSAGDVIDIRGYTDLTGDRAHNLKLSETRATNVAAAIAEALGQNRNAVTFKTRGEGANDLVDNRLPEGRFLSRTVFVTILKSVQ